MLIAAAICPHPPLLIPEVSGRCGPGDAELDRLRIACRQSVAALAAERPDLIAVVGGAPRTGEYPPDAAASLAEFGLPVPGDGPAGAPILPLSLSIGKWLLAPPASPAPASPAQESPAQESPAQESPAPESSGPVSPQVTWWGIAADAPAGECLELGEKIAALAPRVALLAMGDGPGRRARGAPGAADAAADRYDDQVAAALAAPSPGALAALDPDRDPELFIAGRAAWQVLAGAAGQDDFGAALSYAAAPFEVTYFVATWWRAH